MAIKKLLLEYPDYTFTTDAPGIVTIEDGVLRINDMNAWANNIARIQFNDYIGEEVWGTVRVTNGSGYISGGVSAGLALELPAGGYSAPGGIYEYLAYGDGGEVVEGEYEAQFLYAEDLETSAVVPAAIAVQRISGATAHNLSCDIHFEFDDGEVPPYPAGCFWAGIVGAAEDCSDAPTEE